MVFNFTVFTFSFLFWKETKYWIWNLYSFLLLHLVSRVFLILLKCSCLTICESILFNRILQDMKKLHCCSTCLPLRLIVCVWWCQELKRTPHCVWGYPASGKPSSAFNGQSFQGDHSTQHLSVLYLHLFFTLLLTIVTWTRIK